MKITFQGNVVYIAASKRLFDEPIFDSAIAYAKYAGAKEIVDPRKMFSSNQEWRKAFPDYLHRCDVIVIVSDNQIIGKGVYSEYSDFFDRYCKAYIFTPCLTTVGNKGIGYQLRLIDSVEVTDENDWINYAVVHY